jgi:spectrin beta
MFQCYETDNQHWKCNVLPTKGKMRIHCLENVDKALQFLYEQKVHLENLGAHDIVDGSSRLTLGLIWTIIRVVK